MKYDKFMIYVFSFSQLSKHSQSTYKQWGHKLCSFVGTPHLLDISPDNITRFLAHLHNDRCFSASSLALVRSALKYIFCRLLVDMVPELARIEEGKAAEIKKILSGRFSHANKLPEAVSRDKVSQFFEALPDTERSAVADVITPIYYNFRKPGNEYSKQYLQQVCARAARQAGIQHGFGMRQLRSSGIIHAIQNRENDLELVDIFQRTGLSYQQFLNYRKAAGDLVFEHN